MKKRSSKKGKRTYSKFRHGRPNAELKAVRRLYELDLKSPMPKTETVEEFLARGGKIEKTEAPNKARRAVTSRYTFKDLGRLPGVMVNGRLKRFG